MTDPDQTDVTLLELRRIHLTLEGLLELSATQVFHGVGADNFLARHRARLAELDPE